MIKLLVFLPLTQSSRRWKATAVCARGPQALGGGPLLSCGLFKINLHEQWASSAHKTWLVWAEGAWVEGACACMWSSINVRGGRSHTKLHSHEHKCPLLMCKAPPMELCACMCACHSTTPPPSWQGGKVGDHWFMPSFLPISQLVAWILQFDWNVLKSKA